MLYLSSCYWKWQGSSFTVQGYAEQKLEIREKKERLTLVSDFNSSSLDQIGRFDAALEGIPQAFSGRNRTDCSES